MHTFTYTPNPDNPHDDTKVVIATEAEALENVLRAFTAYLRAAGFSIDGELDVVDPMTGETKE